MQLLKGLMMFYGHLSAGKCLQRSPHRTDMALKNDVPPFFWYQKWRKIKPCSLRAPRSCALAAQDSQVRTRPKDPQVSSWMQLDVMSCCNFCLFFLHSTHFLYFFITSSQCPSETAAKKLTQILLESISAECTYHLVMTNIAMENQHF